MTWQKIFISNCSPPYRELIHHPGRGSGGVKQHYPETPGVVHDLEAGQDVGPGAVAQADDGLHSEVVQHVHEVLADVLHAREVSWEIKL